MLTETCAATLWAVATKRPEATTTAHSVSNSCSSHSKPLTRLRLQLDFNLRRGGIYLPAEIL